MADEIKIELNEQARRIMDGQGSARMLQAIARTMDQQNQLVIGHIIAARMTGKGPFPPAEKKLGVVTGRLRRSLRASKAVTSETGVESAIGTNVEYAGIHEFGGTINIKARSGTVRLAATKSGALVRQSSGSNLAVFARRSRKTVREVQYQAAAYTIEMPKRAPIFTGIQDKQQQYADALSAAIIKSVTE